jgi:hypothetical protein
MDLALKLPFLGGSKDPAQPLLAPDRSQLVTPANGARWLQAAREGRVFTGNMAAAGAVLPIYSNAAQVCGIWNPFGSGVNVVPIRLGLTYVDTTGAAGGYVLAAVLNAPGQLATAANITAFTDGVLNTSIFNAKVGDAKGPKARFTPSAATVTAPIVLRHLSLDQNAFTANGTGQMPFSNEVAFDGDLIIPPGVAVFIAGNIATLAKLACSLTWAEEPATL